MLTLFTSSAEVCQKAEEILQSCYDESLIRLSSHLFPLFSSCPASTKYHHSFQGGLLLHISEMIVHAHSVYASFNSPSVEMESLYRCILLHDLEKCVKYVFDVSKQQYVYDEIRNPVEIPDIAIVLHLYYTATDSTPTPLTSSELHAIAHSHGAYGPGANSMTPLAHALHHTDMFSAHLLRYLLPETYYDSFTSFLSERYLS
jgi:hypothetical protein